MAEDAPSVGYESEETKHPWIKVVFVLSALIIGLATATQVLAYKFGYHEALGFNYRHAYFPGMFLAWYWELGGDYPLEFRTAVSYGMAASAAPQTIPQSQHMLAKAQALGRRRCLAEGLAGFSRRT